MKHFGEDDLILHFYGESAESEDIERHLGDCEACRTEYDALIATFEAADTIEVPDRNDAYPREVWARLQREIDRRQRSGWRAWLAPRRLVPVAGVVILVVVAFLAGQWRGREDAVEEIAGSIPPEVRERILLAAVGNHLERSHRLLIELTNAGGHGEVDVTDQRDRARSLVNVNRVYRRTVQKDGDPAVAELLGDLERILLAVANGPDSLGEDDLLALQERIGRGGLLLKVRVLGDRARDGSTASTEPMQDRV